ncbi:lipocalin family protein [Spongiibacter sp.]|uniref:lipocalin family protein n=1 Tax=Spongiibacter sp. TaxID=2024860 RepID=UPI003568AD2E
MKQSTPEIFLLGLLLSLTLAPALATAAIDGFHDRYTATVSGQTWVLYLDGSRSFPSMVSAKLQMGDALNRHMLLGSIEGTTITGSYKPLYGGAMAEEKPFSLQRISDNSVRLVLAGQQLLMSAGQQQAPVDDTIIGTWNSDTKLGINTRNPYMGEQWSIHFRADGTVCETTYMVDSRQPSQYRDPCDKAPSQQWKAENGKIHYSNADGQWQEQFNYRIMGGRLVVSYPGGLRRVTSPAESHRISAQ